jgi:hypothetical protein
MYQITRIGKHTEAEMALTHSAAYIGVTTKQGSAWWHWEFLFRVSKWIFDCKMLILTSDGLSVYGTLC